MKQYIDKAAIVAEIEKRIKETESMRPKFDQFWAGQISAFKGILKILDTLEVKDVDLEKEINKYISDNFFGSETMGFFASRTKEEPNDIDIALCAKYFFKLGLKAKGKFPELAESEDERIRKALILHIAKISTEIPVGALHRINGVDIPDILSWLEKQVEQNPDDIIESKFKIGDFIVNDYCFGKVIEITNDAYLLDTGQGIPFSCEHNAHLWTIADAKEGDVLVTKNFIFIFKNIDNGNGVHYYCHYEINKHEDDNQFGVALPQSLIGRVGNSISHYSPATKEQRELLFKKMYEAGYEFDFNKKELKKTPEESLGISSEKYNEIVNECIFGEEKKSKWSEEDDYNVQCCIAKAECDIENGCIGRNKELIEWLKSLKQRLI